jgi:hypothetical protein
VACASRRSRSIQHKEKEKRKKMRLLRLTGLALAILGVSCSAFAGTVALWNYNSATTAPNIGTGSVALRGGVAFDKWDTDLGDWGAVHANGQIDGKVINGKVENDSSDPMPIVNPGTPIRSRGIRATYKSWNLSTAPGAQAVVWRASTAGISTSNIKVKMDVRAKPYNPRYFQLQYSTDGTNFTTCSTIFQATQPGGDMTLWNNEVEMDLSGISGVANNQSFAFAFIMAYGPGANSYEQLYSGVPAKSPVYAFDTVEVYAGTSDITRVSSPFGPAPVIPEPASFLAIGTGLIGLMGFSRRRTH